MCSEPLENGSSGERDDDELRRWILAARAGSTEAFEQLFDGCRGYLLSVARREITAHLRRKTRPSSLVQTTFIAAQASFERFHGNSQRELFAWLRGILRKQMADRARFFWAKRRDADRELSLERDLDGADRSGLVVDERMTPGHAAMRDEEARALRDAMNRLPSDYRLVLRLRNWDGLPFAEVGRRVGKSEEAVRKVWVRAVEELKRELDQSDERPCE